MVNFNSTIFKTITDEVSGANKSIRLFGKSFAELKNIISSVKTNGLFNTSTISEADVECIKKYNNAIALNIPHQQAMEQATKGASDATAQMIKNANGNTIALNKMTLGAKAASVAMKALSIAGNMIAFWAISKGISLVAEGITWAYKQISGKAAEEAKQKIKELGETARSEFQSIQDTLKSTVSRVDEVKDRYAELAQGVENLGKSNQSRGKLSTEDYDEFLSISNELSGLMPELTKTYDDNGNAILSLNGDIQTITNSLDEFVEAQKRMAAQDMFTKMPDIYSDYRQTVSEYADKYNNSQDKANIYKDLIENNSIQNPLNFVDGDEIRKAFLSKGIDEDTVSQLIDWSNLYNIDDFD